MFLAKLCNSMTIYVFYILHIYIYTHIYIFKHIIHLQSYTRMHIIRIYTCKSIMSYTPSLTALSWSIQVCIIQKSAAGTVGQTFFRCLWSFFAVPGFWRKVICCVQAGPSASQLSDKQIEGRGAHPLLSTRLCFTVFERQSAATQCHKVRYKFPPDLCYGLRLERVDKLLQAWPGLVQGGRETLKNIKQSDGVARIR